MLILAKAIALALGALLIVLNILLVVFLLGMTAGLMVAVFVRGPAKRT